uniref:Titin n=1 Tax=Denticeps clupeoides TaxID=299321 RepID=A0AAY4B5W5_9TELE
MKEVTAEEWNICTPPAGVQTTRFTIENLKENAEYNFRICAINSEGVGDHADVHGSVVIAEKVEAPEIELDADLRKVVSVRAGGSLRLFVTIRGRPTPAVTWEKAEETLTDRAQIESTSSYTMLVIDNVNRFDSGKYILNLENTSGTKSAFVNVRVLDTPSAPQKFEVKDVKKDSVTLCWEPPLMDGGAKITNYIVEKRESTRKAFTTVMSNCTQTFFKIDELQEGGIFYFRVCAVNEFGCGPITVKDNVDPPRIMMDVKFRDVVVVKAGETLKIHADFAGRPLPIALWTKDGKEIELKARIQVSGTDTSTTVTIKDCIRSDSGQYVLTLQNVAGSVSMPVNCVILDKPGPSAGPLVVSGITAEECNLTWGPPQEKGGAEITHYVLEKRETSRLAWTLVHGEVKKTGFRVTNLLKENEYIFRVLAVNKYGNGEALESDAIKVYVTSEFMALSWAKPASDGGSEIFGYIIERREKSSIHWIRVNRELTCDLKYEVTKLRKGCEYEFRVYAENAAGLSLPSDPSTLARAEDKLDVPASPTKPKIVDSTKNSVSVSWNKPLSDGGTPILGYSVEYKKTEDEEWTTAVQITKNMEFIVSGLTADVEYVFAVKAINKIGVSDISPVSEPQVAKDREEAPVFDVDIEMRKTLIVKHGHSFTLTAPFKGKPVPSTTSHIIKGLRENAEYLFRVRAENHAGLSEPKEMIIPVIVREQLGKLLYYCIVYIFRSLKRQKHTI